MIPGMTGPVAMNGEFVPLSLTSVALFDYSSSAESATVAWPTGHRIGDLALLYDWKYRLVNDDVPASVVPEGFTAIQNATGASGETGDPGESGRTRAIVSYKILDGTEPAEGFVTGMSPENRRERKILTIFRGNVRVKSVTPQSLVAQININPSQVTITSSAGQVPLIVFAFNARNTANPFFTVNSPAFSETVAAETMAIGGYSIYTGTPVNHTVDTDGSGAGGSFQGGNLLTGYLELSSEEST